MGIHHIKSFFKLIRWPNILFIALTQILIRYFVIKPMLENSGFELQLSTFNFFLLVLSTCLIAASGYIINDYFDIKIDWINKPGKNEVSQTISRRWAIFLHVLLNVVALAAAFWLSVNVGSNKLFVIFGISAGLLWFYSTTFKYQFFVGNLVVAGLLGTVPLLVALFELPMLYAEYGSYIEEKGMNFNYIAIFIIGFSAYAFWGGLIREIIKDAEDVEGDSAYGSDTIPVKLGYTYTNYILVFLWLIMIASLTWLQYRQWITGDKASFFYMLFFIQLPALFASYKTISAKGKENYSMLSKLSKFILFSGLMYSVIIWWVLK
jgi:4-hydroxybenzoate polyprenyltransferase